MLVTLKSSPMAIPTFNKGSELESPTMQVTFPEMAAVIQIS